MQSKLKSFAAQIYYFHNEVQTVFEHLSSLYDIQTVFSHQEIGNKVTFDRDIAMESFFDDHKILWKQAQLHGVIRKLRSKQDWDKRWEETMRAIPKMIDLNTFEFEDLDPDYYQKLKGKALSTEITNRHENFQQGGEYWAWRYL